MNTMKKRILSSALAVATAASMAVPAFAVDDTVITATYTETEIAVSVPGATAAVINPYGLGAEVSVGSTTQNVSGQVTTPVMIIKNQSGMRLNVGASVTTKVEGGLTIAKSVSSTVKTKTAAVKLQVVSAPATVKGTEAATAEDTELVAGEYLKEANWAEAQSLQLATEAAVVSKDTSPLAVLSPAKLKANGDLESYEEGSIAMMRLTGNVVTSPKKADGSDDAWAATDKFVATVKYTFTPVANTEE